MPAWTKVLLRNNKVKAGVKPQCVNIPESLGHKISFQN